MIAALGEFPRVALAHCPTPLEPMSNLSQAVGVEGLFVKRDDCTGLAMGGNKARQLEQASDTGIDIGSVVVASGSAQTHAGLLVGLRASGRGEVQVHGICVRRRADAQGERVLRCARGVEELLGLGRLLSPEDVSVTDRYLGAGYGQPTRESEEAILLAARREGLLIDPVYTGKALAGMLGLARGGAFEGRPAVFLHTGGTPALFGYGSRL